MEELNKEQPKVIAVNKKKKYHFFETFISKVLKQVSSSSGITSNAKQQLNSALIILSKKISSIVVNLTEISKKKTISEKEVINALSIIINGDLLSKSIYEGKKALSNFNDLEKTKGSSRQNKAGIIFPPSIMEKFLRNFGNSKLMVTSTAPIFFAAAIEYITAEILDLASISSKDFKRVRITIRDLELAIRNDEELDSLFTKLNISFLGGGVLPFIHTSLLKKNKKKKPRNFIPKNENKGHRFRAGTVAIRDIKKHQKTSNCLILPKFSFERFVRVIFKEIQQHENQKISKDVFIVLQYFIEQYIVNILKNANFLAIHAGRVKLMPVDIGLVSCFYNNTKNPYNLSLNDDNIDILSINDDDYNDNIDDENDVKEDQNGDNKEQEEQEQEEQDQKDDDDNNVDEEELNEEE